MTYDTIASFATCKFMTSPGQVWARRGMVWGMARYSNQYGSRATPPTPPIALLLLFALALSASSLFAQSATPTTRPAVTRVVVHFADGSHQTLPADPTEEKLPNEPNFPSTSPSSPNPEPLPLRLTLAGLMAPAAVHVAVPDLTLRPDLLESRFDWDFGDEQGKYNRLTGFNAAHLYDQPGAYTIRLTITDPAGQQTRYQTDFLVRPDTRRQILVRTQQDLDALPPIGDNIRLVFQGESFNLKRRLDIRGSNVVITSTGPRPRLNCTSTQPDSTYFFIPRDASSILIENLSFDTPAQAKNTNAFGGAVISPAGRNVTIRNNEFLNVSYAVQGNGRPAGLLVQDNTVPLPTGLRGYLVWGEGSDYVILGNTVANSTREHIVRVTRISRLLISHNDFTNLDRRSQDPSDYTKTTLSICDALDVYIAGNKLTDGPLRFGPLALGGSTMEVQPFTGLFNKDIRTDTAVAEDNDLFGTWIEAHHGTENLMVRNNILQGANIVAFQIDGYNSEFTRQPQNINILHNTVIDQGTDGNFLRTGHGPGAITLKNNLYVAPKLTAGSGGAVIYVEDTDLSTFKQIRNNLWPIPKTIPYAQGGYFYVWPKWSDPKGFRTPDAWRALGAKDDDYENTALDPRTCQPLLDSKAARRGAGAVRR